MSSKFATTSDYQVQATAGDAAKGKLSCVTQGYFSDPFIQYFSFEKDSSRLSPLINRGYFARVCAFEGIIRSFLRFNEEAGVTGKQIISLGGGNDTAFWRLCKYHKVEKGHLYRWFEIDFPEVVAEKARNIDRHKDLRSVLDLDGSHSYIGPNGVMSGKYSLIAGDLRDISSITKALVAAGVDFSRPTLFLNECVLVYLDPIYSNKLIKWAAASFQDAGAAFVSYEQVKPGDAFGQMMLYNLETRGCPLLSISRYPSLESLKLRYVDECGWEEASVLDMNVFYKEVLNPETVARIEALEIFDEFEEWCLINSHYSIALAINYGSTKAMRGYSYAELKRLSLQ